MGRVWLVEGLVGGLRSSQLAGWPTTIRHLCKEISCTKSNGSNTALDRQTVEERNNVLRDKLQSQPPCLLV